MVETAAHQSDHALPPLPVPAAVTPADAPHRAAARYLWSTLLAHIYAALAPAATLNADEAGVSLH